MEALRREKVVENFGSDVGVTVSTVSFHCKVLQKAMKV